MTDDENAMVTIHRGGPGMDMDTETTKSCPRGLLYGFCEHCGAGREQRTTIVRGIHLGERRHAVLFCPECGREAN